MAPFTVTSPTNALSVVVYGMFTFYGLTLILDVANAVTIPAMIADIWAMLLFMAASVSLYAVLSAPRRRDPDRSLRLEFHTSVALCTLLGYLSYTIATYDGITVRFPVTSFGLCVIFFLGFGARAVQIFFERRAIRKFRNGPPPVDNLM